MRGGLRWGLLLAGSFFVAACSREADPRGGAVKQSMSPQALREVTGLSEFPRPRDKHALLAAVQRHYPPALRTHGGSGSVLVDVGLDELGNVVSVTGATPPGGLHTHTMLVTRDRSGAETERPLVGHSDPALVPAAEAALREVSFTPAIRDGKAVPYTLRMTVRFTP